MPERRKPNPTYTVKSDKHPLGHFHVVDGKNVIGGNLSQVVSEEHGQEAKRLMDDEWRRRYNKPANASPGDINLPNDKKPQRRKLK